jgi:hypothetical protein
MSGGFSLPVFSLFVFSLLVQSYSRTVSTVGACDGCEFNGRASRVRVIAASDVQGRVVIVLRGAVSCSVTGQCYRGGR